MSEFISSQTAFVMPEINSLIPKISLGKENTFFNQVNQKSHINATNDLAAVEAWLNKHKNSFKTYTAYKREAERLLLWCAYVRRLTLSQLKVEDFTVYFGLCQFSVLFCCSSSLDFVFTLQLQIIH